MAERTKPYKRKPELAHGRPISAAERSLESEPNYGISLDIEPQEAKSASVIPVEKGHWQYEPKWDGFRCLAFKAGHHIELRGRSGKSLSRYFPEVVAALRKLNSTHFVLDGELTIERAGILDFDALQMRLHPAASRIEKLSKQTPAHVMLFDMLVRRDGEKILDQPLRDRRQRLEDFFTSNHLRQPFILSPATLDPQRAEQWLRQAGQGATDGVVAKRLDQPYRPGLRTMIKVKRLRTADCVIGGFRYAHNSRAVGSLLLGLYGEDGKLDHVGYTTTIAAKDRQALTKRLESLRAEPGFSGRAPAGPSRWSKGRDSHWEPVRPELVVEVRFDHVTGNRLRHGTKLLRWRPDKSPRQCTFEQLA
jgi:ATP-dependent DNA ligase